MKPLHATALFLGLLAGCTAKESSRTLETQTVASAGTAYHGPRYAISIGKFENTSPYMNALFSDGEDRIGNQARTILKTHLTESGRFDLLDRENMTELAQEAELAGTELDLAAAQVVLTGQVTEFGRKTSGGQILFGLAGREKAQTAYSKVSVSVVDVRTGRVLHSVQGAGEFSLENRELLGTGSTAGYDSTLNGKVLNLAITDAVNKLVFGLESGAWSPSGAN